MKDTGGEKKRTLLSPGEEPLEEREKVDERNVINYTLNTVLLLLFLKVGVN